VRARFLDDAEGGRWDPVAVGENARRAAADSSTAAYIGDLDSGATRTSLPILNEAEIAQVSPGATAIDLTRSAPGYEDSPERYRPSGDATFARVVPTDDSLARAAVELAASEGASEILLLDAKADLFAAAIADAVRDEAADRGLPVTDTRGPRTLTIAAGDDVGVVIENGAGSRLSPAIEPQFLGAQTGESEADPQPFEDRFRDRFGRPPGPSAAYGFEAMALALQAIGEADRGAESFREEVVDGLLGAQRSGTVLGDYSITKEGDTTLCLIQPYRVEGGQPIPLSPVCVPD
jgi:branched-chain amino acid transport system substrate-binding protein